MKRLFLSLLMAAMAMPMMGQDSAGNRTRTQLVARYDIVSLQWGIVTVLKLDTYSGEAWVSRGRDYEWEKVPRLADPSFPQYDKPTYQVTVIESTAYLMDTNTGRTWILQWSLNHPSRWQEIRTNAANL